MTTPPALASNTADIKMYLGRIEGISTICLFENQLLLFLINGVPTF